MALIKTNSWIAMRTKLLFRSTKTLSFESTNIDRAEANDRSASRCFIRAKQTTAPNYISTCHRDFFAEPTNVFLRVRRGLTRAIGTFVFVSNCSRLLFER